MLKPRVRDGPSRNASEPTVEASKRKDGSGQPAGFGEACTGGESDQRETIHA